MPSMISFLLIVLHCSSPKAWPRWDLRWHWDEQRPECHSHSCWHWDHKCQNILSLTLRPLSSIVIIINIEHRPECLFIIIFTTSAIIIAIFIVYFQSYYHHYHHHQQDHHHYHHEQIAKRGHICSIPWHHHLIAIKHSKQGLNKCFEVSSMLICFQKNPDILPSYKWKRKGWTIFIGPRSDHSLLMSVTDWLTKSRPCWRLNELT